MNNLFPSAILTALCILPVLYFCGFISKKLFKCTFTAYLSCCLGFFVTSDSVAALLCGTLAFFVCVVVYDKTLKKSGRCIEKAITLGDFSDGFGSVMLNGRVYKAVSKQDCELCGGEIVRVTMINDGVCAVYKIKKH